MKISALMTQEQVDQAVTDHCVLFPGGYVLPFPGYSDVGKHFKVFESVDGRVILQGEGYLDIHRDPEVVRAEGRSIGGESECSVLYHDWFHPLDTVSATPLYVMSYCMENNTGLTPTDLRYVDDWYVFEVNEPCSEKYFYGGRFIDGELWLIGKPGRVIEEARGMIYMHRTYGAAEHDLSPYLDVLQIHRRPQDEEHHAS